MSTSERIERPTDADFIPSTPFDLLWSGMIRRACSRRLGTARHPLDGSLAAASQRMTGTRGPCHWTATIAGNLRPEVKHHSRGIVARVGTCGLLAGLP